jgi:Peptidase family M23
MRLRVVTVGALATFAASVAPGFGKDPLRLALPVACEPRKTCFIQNFVDHDAGSGVRDYACGSATYDGHTGVDFRVLSAASTAPGVAVLAAADGTVKGVRDGVADVFIRDGKPGDVKGRECGNGVLIEHGDGWETQYCHLKQGSLRVTNNQAVKRGDHLGDVGFSGHADFAHLHLSVRRNGKAIDPFLPDAIDGACQRDAKTQTLWLPEVAAKLPYKSGEILGSGFAGSPPDFRALEVDHRNIAPPSSTSEALVFYGRLMNLVTGDRVRIIIMGPGGPLVEELSAPLVSPKATYLSFAGKKRKSAAWPSGRYEGRVELVREGAVIAANVATIDIKP